MSRVHVLTPNTLSLPREGILTVAENKIQVNKMLYSSQLEPEFLELTEAFEHKLYLSELKIIQSKYTKAL